MDGTRFDLMTRALGDASSRRSLIGVAAGLLAAPLAAQQADARTRRKRQPGPEGPCGDGSSQANRCKNHADCCTGYCKDGRCRGVELGGKCSATRKCRGEAVCIDRRCTRKNGPGPGPTPASCTPENCPNGCCDGTTCVPYAGQSHASCGTAGAACAPCGDGSGSPTGCNEIGVCSECYPGNCTTGCCNGPVCFGPNNQSDDLCGAGGVVCGTCTAPNHCNASLMRCSPCNGVSCANGCCDGDTCVPLANQTIDMCGNYGAACVACSQYSACNVGGYCDPVPCNSTTCAQGCCEPNGVGGYTCIPYAQQYLGQCGTGGQQCFICGGYPAPTACTQGVCTV